MKLNERVILHCDANNFYASVETIYNPDLKDKPVAVSGNPKKRTGIILAKNELAKKNNVKTGEPIWQAKLKCPNLVCLPPHHGLYEQYSKRLKEIYLNYTDKVEPFGIDECWLDVTFSLRLYKSGEEIAELIRKRVKAEIGITISVGVSFCKLFAKLASDLKKPDAITVIKRADYKKIIYPLPISVIMGIGRNNEKHLALMNINTLGDFVAFPSQIIKEKFGKVGIELKEKLSGFDTDEVIKDTPLPKSVGNGSTTISDIITKEELKDAIYFLSEKVAARLRDKNLFARGVSINVKTSEFEHFGKESKIEYPTNSADIIAKEAIKILNSFWHFDKFIRAVRVKTFDLLTANEFAQASMFKNETKQGLGYGLDLIWNKYGHKSITLASNLKSKFLSVEEDD